MRTIPENPFLDHDVDEARAQGRAWAKTRDGFPDIDLPDVVAVTAADGPLLNMAKMKTPDRGDKRIATGLAHEFIVGVGQAIDWATAPSTTETNNG